MRRSWTGSLGFVVVAACAAPELGEPMEHPSTEPFLAESENADALGGARPEGDVDREGWDGPTLQAAAEFAAGIAFGRNESRGVIALGSDHFAYLFGTPADVWAVVDGARPQGPVDAVLLDFEGECAGVMGAVPFLPTALRDDVAAWLEAAEAEGAELLHCPSETLDEHSLQLAAGSLSIEARELAEDGDDIPVLWAAAACASSCGSTQGYSYAGEKAYSNGSYTGTGSSCNGTDTYGYRYQCVQYTERVHHRSDWAGNAYTGYWTNTGLTSGTQGPYYKGLLPLGSGTPYAAPISGDVLVWSGGSDGHVGIISSVAGSTITNYDQNRSCGDQSCNLSYSTAGGVFTLSNGAGSGYCGSEGLGSYTVRGYLHRGWDFGGTYGLAANSTDGATYHNWWPTNATYSGSTTSGSVTDITDYISINPGTSDPYLTSPPGLGLPAYSASATHGYKYFRVYIKSACANKNAEFFWKRTTDGSFSESRKVTATIVGTGWQSLYFNPSSSSYWSGTIDQVRIDPASGCAADASDTISIQSAYFYR